MCSINVCLVVILLSGCCLGLKQNETPVDNAVSSHTLMKTVMKKALSNNTALIDIFRDGNESISNKNSMKSLTLSALGTPSISWNQFLTDQDKDSVPLSTRRKSVNTTLSNSNHNETTTPKTQTQEQLPDTSAINETKTVTQRKVNTIEGVYIPMDRLSRTRRQVPIREQNLSNRRRVLFLLNPNMPRRAINRTMLRRPSLMLVRNTNNTIHHGPRLGRLPNQQRQVTQVPGRTHLSVTRRQPAIQSIDLSNVDLDSTSASTSSVGGKAVPMDTSTAPASISRSAIPQTGNVLVPNNQLVSLENTDLRRQSGNIPERSRPVQPQNERNSLSNTLQRSVLEPQLIQTLQNNLSRSDQNTISRRQPITISGRLSRPEQAQRGSGQIRRNSVSSTIQQSMLQNRLTQAQPDMTNSNSRRQTVDTSGRVRPDQTQSARGNINSLSSTIRRPLLEPRFAHEQPVRSRRIAFLLRPNATRTGSGGSFVRTVLPSSGRHVMLSRNRQQTQNSPRTRAATAVLRTNQSGVQRNAPLGVPQRNVVRNTQSGVQRGTNTAMRRAPVLRIQRPPVRRVTRPADPFTQRFSAGFQRGDQLLHQPDSTETRGFDGSVRRNNFRNNNFGPPFRGGFPPPGRPGFINGPFGF